MTSSHPASDCSKASREGAGVNRRNALHVLAGAACALAPGRSIASRAVLTSPIFEAAFRPGAILSGRHDGRRFRVTPEVFTLGRLSLPTGQLVACDPYWDRIEGKAFRQPLRSGVWPVEAAVVDDPDWGRRVGFTRLKLSDAIAVRWELAEVSQTNPASGTGDEPHAFGVDSGVGCYMSRQVAEVLLRMEPSEREAQIAEWDRKIGSNPTAVGGTGTLLDVKVGPGNVIAFATGIGDGMYWSWLGYDANDSVTALVTNFALFDLHSTRASWPGQL